MRLVQFAPTMAIAAATGVSALSYGAGDRLFSFLLFSAALFGASVSPAVFRPGFSPRRVFWTAVLIHGVGLVGTPLFEDDFYRYLWDGYRTAASGSPYGAAPSHFFDDPSVPERMQAVLDGVNYPDVPTIYGPVLQLIFLAAHLLSPANERTLRVVFAGANLVLIAVLLRRAKPDRVALYAWSPLVFKEVPLSGHPDAVLALFLLLGWVYRQRWRGAGLAIALGLAVAVKVVALAAWPLLLRCDRRLRLLGVAGAAFALAYVPFLAFGEGGATDLAGFVVFAARWEFNPGLYALVQHLAGPAAAKAGLGVAAIATILVIHCKARDGSLYPFHRIFGVILAVSPVINPWYLLWGLPFAITSREVWPWAASYLVLLAYATGSQIAGGLAPFEVHPAARAFEIVGIAAAVGWDVFRHARLAQRRDGGA